MNLVNLSAFYKSFTFVIILSTGRKESIRKERGEIGRKERKNQRGSDRKESRESAIALSRNVLREKDWSRKDENVSG